MKKLINTVLVVLLIVFVIAYFTKPSASTCTSKVTQELEKRGYKVAIHILRDKNDHVTGVSNDLTIKDRMLYRDIYYPYEGDERKIAIGAFGKIFLVN
jgi:hypothetical protein